MKSNSRSILLRGAAAGMAAVLLAMAGLVLGGGGATGTGYRAFGRLSDFGSIFVNGIEFFTTKAAITINGVPNRPESDLRIGMVLTVDGAVDSNGKTGNAATVEYHADALGAIDAAPVQGAGRGSFGVLGQTVLTDAGTVFAGVIGLADLALGDIVEVSGFATADGLLASRVERRGSIPGVQVQGAIANVTATTFSVGALSVDYSGAALKNVPAGGFAAGQTVVAKGPSPVENRLAATSVEVIVTGTGNSNGSLAGVIAAASASSITVNGHALTVTTSTQYVNGSAADLATGKLVKVDYTVIAAKATATRIEFTKLDAPAFIEGDVTAVNTGSVEILGPGGVLVTANAATQSRDGSDARMQNFTLAAVNVGDHLEVDGNQVNEDVVLATRLVRRRPSTAITLQGRTLNVAAPTFTVIDLPVTVNDATDIRDPSGTRITADAFFAKAAGHDVTVSAARQGAGLVAISVRLDY